MDGSGCPAGSTTPNLAFVLETITPVRGVLPEEKCTIYEQRPGESLFKRQKGAIFKPWLYDSLASPGELRIWPGVEEVLAERALDKIKYGIIHISNTARGRYILANEYINLLALESCLYPHYLS